MDRFNSREDLTNRSGHDSNAPPSCPACHSASVISTSKSPSANSYWRCNGCGEIWNVSRRHDQRRGGWR